MRILDEDMIEIVVLLLYFCVICLLLSLCFCTLALAVQCIVFVCRLAADGLSSLRPHAISLGNWLAHIPLPVVIAAGAIANVILVAVGMLVIRGRSGGMWRISRDSRVAMSLSTAAYLAAVVAILH